VRGFIAASGFLVFLVSAKLFGADGRGVISYGTSIFATFGLFFSLNLGRTFVGKTSQNESLKKDFIFTFMLLNIGAIILTSLLGYCFWNFSLSAHEHLSAHMLIPFLATSIFYVWNVNGNLFFASFQRTHEQEIIILITRFALVSFLILFTVIDVKNLFYFICFYSLILSLGSVSEFILLLRIVGRKHHFPNWKNLKTILQETIWPHLDFLSFNLYPLLLVLIAGKYLETAKIGRINFAIQIINLIFLLSTTANIRVNAYVSNFGFRTKLEQIKKLFWWTFFVSTVASLLALLVLSQLSTTSYLGSFDGVATLFGIAIFSIPGYMAYQFLNPILLEMKRIKESAYINLFNSFIVIILSPFLIEFYNEIGSMVLFALFHIGLLFGQYFVFLRYIKNVTEN